VVTDLYTPHFGVRRKGLCGEDVCQVESRPRSKDKAGSHSLQNEAKEDKLRTAWVMFDSEQQIFKSDRMKTYKEKRIAERKADQETREAEREANIEKIEPTECTIAILEQMIERLWAGQEEMKAKADADTHII
jgi:hypothetical protein